MARLLMNWLLLQKGYPPAMIRPEDRRRYVNALEQGQTGGAMEGYHQVIYDAVERSLDIYLHALEESAGS
jgi:Fic family protein